MSQPSYPMNVVYAACSAVVLSFVLSACNAGHSTAVADNADTPMAQENLAAQNIAGAGQEDPREVADAAPKRGPNDPIFVNLAAPVLDSKMQKAEKPKGAIWQHIRNEFASDPIIQLIPNSKTTMKQKTSQATPRVPDVEVASTVSLQEVLGVNAKTGKPSKTLNIVFEATISSQALPATYRVSESGHVLKNMAVSKRFAKQIRDVIVEKIGPQIPVR